MGPYEAPLAVPQTLGLPVGATSLTKIVPFNDPDVVEATPRRYWGRVAGMIATTVLSARGSVTYRLEEWAYVRLYRSNAERLRALPRWLAFYDRRRPHTALGGRPPMSRL